MKLGLVLGLLTAVGTAAQAAPEIVRPRLLGAVVDWPGAFAALGKVDGLRADNKESDSSLLARINKASEPYLPNVEASPIPVLLPVDVAAVLRDHGKASEPGEPPNAEPYFNGFHGPRFFLAGPAGFDSTFSIQTNDIKELSDIPVHDPVDIHFSGFAFYYDLDDPAIEARGVPALDAKYPGIRRFIHEGFVRYAFVHYGVPYVLAIDCFDGRPRILRLLCPQADRIAIHFLDRLQIAGGAPQPPPTMDPPVVVRPHTKDTAFSYYGPGRLLAGSSFRDSGGRVDYTVFAPIRFPLAEAPAYANSQLYRENQTKPYRGSPKPSDYTYPWRDNFCERRGFTVGQCPGGVGHQGQDIRASPCPQPLGNGRCDPAHDIVAVRTGAIMRSPKQEAVYIVINNANEHLRFRYLHMEPRKMDEDNLLSGRDVKEGEVIGKVSNYSQKENGTSYHLHFDIQVPTKNGWVFVSPYMTLVVAYERLIGGRGVELFDVPHAAQAKDLNAIDRPESAFPASTAKPQSRSDGAREPTSDQAGVKELLENRRD